MYCLRGRAGITGGALIIMAGLAIPAATATPATAATQQVPGTDVSNFTTVSSWTNVAAAGNKFVSVEAVDGATVVNPQYNSQVTGATSAGLFVMPYVLADPLKVDGPTQFSKAWAVISAVPGVPYARGGLMLPIALDMESQPLVTSDPCYGLTPAAMVSWIQAFISAATSQTGAVPVLYTNPNWWKTCTNNSTAFGADPLWIANYQVSSPAVPPGWSGYTIWQSSNAGAINGISGAADLDQMQGAPSTVYAASGSGGSIQVQTLNALAGQTVTYSASGLPAGLSLNSASGVLSWTSATAVGSHPVTVTPSGSAVLPSTVAFTLDVHGTITVASPGNRTTTAGSPVVLGMHTSGPDQNAGFNPSFTASGLPPGLTISSSGQISGWPYKPGSYNVTVSASDTLHGTGSTSFTWTIAAAANSGLTGYIKQVGGSAKCFDDPGGKTANGTLVDVWTCETGHPNESWTRVQDGTIRVLGKCLDVVGESKSVGAKLQLWTCNSGDGAQQWESGTGGQLINPQSGKCIYVPGTSPANGTRLELNGCANVANEHWSRSAAKVVSGAPGGCLGISGSTVELVGCPGSAAPHWLASADGTLRVGTKCLTETGITAGAGLVIGSCTGAAATKWKLTGAGPIAVELASAESGLCVTAPVVANGAKLVIEPCAATPAATWQVL